MENTGKSISSNTVRRILTKQNVEEYAIKLLFKTLNIPYKHNVDVILALKDTSSAKSCHQDFFPVENKHSNFFGRDDDLARLNTLINQHQKMIVIQAPGGLGKTTLARQYLDNQGFDLVLSLEIAREAENITSVESVVEEWLKQYFEEEPGREFGITLARLKKHLQNRQVGILIDSLEPALDKHGRFIQNHSRYLELFRVLADATVQSFTIITSRERLFDDRIDIIYHYYLSELGVSAWQEFFAFHEVKIDISLLEEMHIKYGGNAKAINILLGSIETDYERDATAYWQENCTLVEPGLKNLVVNQFNRLQSLNPNAYKLLCRLGCYRYQDIPQVTEDALLALLWDIPDQQKCIYIIRSLKNLRLFEFAKGKYWLHTVIKEESIKRLKSSQEWEEVNRKAAEFWRGSVKSIRTMEDAKKAFEAYYHYECIHDFEQAGYIIIQRRNGCWSFDEMLAFSYYRMGALTQVISILNLLKEKIKSEYLLASIYSIEGIINLGSGNMNIAINYLNQSLAMANCILNNFENNQIYISYDEIILLIVKNQIHLSFYYIDIWELEAAINILEPTKSWIENIIQKGDKNLKLKIEKYQVTVWLHLALLYSYFNTEEKYILPQSLAKKVYYSTFTVIFAEIVYYIILNLETLLINAGLETEVNFCTWRKIYALLKLGLIYKNLGNIKKSFKIYNAAIEFSQAESSYGWIESAQELNYNSHYNPLVAKVLTGLAELYRIQDNFEEALFKHSQSIEIFHKISGNRCDLAEAYFQLGLTYQKMGDFKNSQINFHEAIILFTVAAAPQQVEKVEREKKNLKSGRL
ncbi:tetratricopeptide repeat protein [Dolichospermum sp. ST_sed1]|nr:tetratricopeptide repeat protein [Dolichospermum sp. ST_sed1]MDD1423958.1 tetratricopeptide repeat protein [Dolichospermum sp. ST_sed9]MDD1440082.1 tetratricopeptide repeat protein [Dolichospermum sp. ST_sed3]MDD1445931.1 tetratricopeptide repeat protein [Dolichospermum sp. ST_sed8]MDD1461478.1 tetratricopeptide repeat protein [Dolichospermum sp. ST_sed2]MDD1463852.1 tetratricopeptide repeat protein [Dolichospermum sp. ST_sed5]MDD1472639.1 tetratricopeptide repeat protein [Dolichospermum s